jgi:hypothetical protein
MRGRKERRKEGRRKTLLFVVSLYAALGRVRWKILSKIFTSQNT